MVAGAFPIAKLVSIAVKQISKPLSSRIKEGAKRSHFFRTYICMPPAQIYHWLEVNIKMRVLNLGKPTEVPKLNESMAIELGAELLGEGTIFLVAAVCLIAEYRRSSNKEKEKEEAREARTQFIEAQLSELHLTVEQQRAQIQELMRRLDRPFRFLPTVGQKSNEGSSSVMQPSKQDDKPPSKVPSTITGSVLDKALDEADKSIRGR